MITDLQTIVTRDAMRRDLRPGALVLTNTDTVVLCTSWPWVEGPDGVVMIMARTLPDDPGTNQPLRYITLSRRVGGQDL